LEVFTVKSNGDGWNDPAVIVDPSNTTRPTGKIVIVFDPETQDVKLDADPGYFKNWPYLIAILQFAVGKAQHLMSVAMKQQQLQALELEAQALKELKKAFPPK
jgi:hypothetical protein